MQHKILKSLSSPKAQTIINIKEYQQLKLSKQNKHEHGQVVDKE